MRIGEKINYLRDLTIFFSATDLHFSKIQKTDKKIFWMINQTTKFQRFWWTLIPFMKNAQRKTQNPLVARDNSYTPTMLDNTLQKIFSYFWISQHNLCVEWEKAKNIIFSKISCIYADKHCSLWVKIWLFQVNVLFHNSCKFLQRLCYRFLWS
jgi:hypothetical protein